MPPEPNTGPIKLEEIIRSLVTQGATYYGNPVHILSLRMYDGRRHRDDLPLPGDDPATIEDETDDLAGMKNDIKQVVLEMAPGELTTNEMICQKAGYAASGKAREFIKTLHLLGLLKKSHRGWQRTGQKIN